MKNIKFIMIILAFTFIFLCTSCDQINKKESEIYPEVSQMRAISELAVMECYFHNVAKYKEEDAEGFWIWKKDKEFWIEYSGTVEIGIDTSLLNIVVEGNRVIITLPEAKVLDSKIDDVSLNEASFIIDKDSADISGEDEAMAFAEAQNKMIMAAENDSTLLSNAQQRVKKLLEEYVMNIGEIVDKEYVLEWKSLID